MTPFLKIIPIFVKKNFMKLYHITRSENIGSIMEKGIIPHYTNGLGRERYGKVFLTNDVNKIINEHGGEKWRTGIAVIEVEGVDYKPHLYTCWKIPVESDFEFVVDKVLPCHIKEVVFY